jgi:Zn-dependent protease
LRARNGRDPARIGSDRAHLVHANDVLASRRHVTVARIWGMPVVLSPTLAGLVVLGVLVAVWSPDSRGLWLGLALGALLSLFAHELAHGLAARHFGYEVDALELSMWGGRTGWSGPTPDAHTALTVAAAGPGMSALLAVVAALAGSETVASVNVTIALVNLVPITGSDGWVIWKAATSSTTPEP